MTNLNKVFLKGNLTRDLGADERSFGYVGNGTARANVSIAVNRSKKQGDQYVDEVSYFDVTIWGKTAENLKPYLVKGKSITIEGFLKQDRWEKDGQKQSRISIVAENVWLDRDGNGSSKPAQSNGNSATAKNGQTGFNPSDGFPEDYPSDIPF